MTGWTTVDVDVLELGYELTIRGESNYQPALRRLFAQAQRWDALLIPEPNNAYDPNAVCVMIGEDKVAYVAKEDAAVISAALLDRWGHAQMVGLEVSLASSDGRAIGVFQSRGAGHAAPESPPTAPTAPGMVDIPCFGCGQTIRTTPGKLLVGVTCPKCLTTTIAARCTHCGEWNSADMALGYVNCATCHKPIDVDPTGN